MRLLALPQDWRYGVLELGRQICRAEMPAKRRLRVLENPFMERQYQPVPMQYAGWFRHEIRSIYEQLRTAGVLVREMITVQQRVISW